MTFQESDLQFQFADIDWQIKKYDAHRYFKILSGAGLSGVDFLGIYKETQVVFWEIKNYHTNDASKTPNYLVIKDTSLFIEKIRTKMEDTLTAIRVVHQYLQRQWWYRFFLQYHQFIPTALVRQKDWYFWYRVQNLVQQEKVVVGVLWLELAIDYTVAAKQELLTEIESTLGKRLNGKGMKILVASMDKRVFKTSLQVVIK